MQIKNLLKSLKQVADLVEDLSAGTSYDFAIRKVSL